MYGTLKRIIWAILLLGGMTSTGLAEETPPIFYPMPAIAVQHETKNCGYDTVMISSQLEYDDQAKTERISAYMPKIMASVYAELKKHLNKEKSVSDPVIKQIVLSAVNGIVGQGTINDVLIMNVVHG